MSSELTSDELVGIHRNAWFAKLDASDLCVLLEEGELREFQAGEYVFRRGDPADGLFGVASGTLKASRLGANGSEAILSLIGQGSWFGEVSSIDKLPRSHDVCVLTPTRLLHAREETIERLLLRPGFSRSLAALQCAHTRGLFELMEDAHLRTTRARIARRIEYLARGDGVLSDSPRRIVSVTQDTLAMMLGLTRQTLSMELRAIASTGAISLSYGHIAIESLDKLRRVDAV
ncbi:Crp/Fnr family transcriptional regulator [Variovorax sp.]|jgi:CRP/FNR family cyclic AMP-dependent transcriptional regulator|uniref:Crp/Fnr family transcriptional regulator n=1 Tax=Variovorax sp. TaxID=1871043 RepID=UPI0037D9A8D1